MFSADQLSQKVAAYAAHEISLDEFDDWFREASENVHLLGDEHLEDYVFAVEHVFSKRYFEHLSEQDFRATLQREARRFARPFVLPELRVAPVVHHNVLFYTATPKYANVLAAVTIAVGLTVPLANSYPLSKTQIAGGQVRFDGDSSRESAVANASRLIVQVEVAVQ